MKLRVSKKNLCDLAEWLGLDIGPRRNIMFRRYDSTGDYALRYVLQFQQHQVFFHCSSESVTLMHSTRECNNMGIKVSTQQFYEIPNALLSELGMIEEEDNAERAGGADNGEADAAE